MTARILQGDVLERLAELPGDHFHCAITSPPYWALRDYARCPCANGREDKQPDPECEECQGTGKLDHHDQQLGSEATPEAYVASMVRVFREVRRVMRPDSVTFVNLGDSYFGSWGNYSRENWGPDMLVQPGYNGREKQRPATTFKHPTLKPGDLCGIPWRTALALQADGWILRDCLHWIKASPMPSSLSGWRWERCRVKLSSRNRFEDDEYAANVGNRTYASGPVREKPQAEWKPCPGCDRCDPNDGLVLRRGAWRWTTAVEFVFMLVKSNRYFADQDAVRTLAEEQAKATEFYAASLLGEECDEDEEGDAGANPRNYLTLASEPMTWQVCEACLHAWDAGGKRKKKCPACRSPKIAGHYAAYPTRLVEPLLRVACSSQGCCAACGGQVVRVVEHPEGGALGASWHNHANDNGEGARQKHSGEALYKTYTRGATIGFRASCTCGAERVGCRVLDPFAGTSTTLLVALGLGHEATGIELSPAYAALSRARLRSEFALMEVV